MDKNILHIINSSGLGGAETITREIISRNKYICFCLKEDRIERFKEVSSSVYFGTRSRYYKLNPFILYRLYKIIRKNKINIIHVHLSNSLFYSILIKFLIPNLIMIYHEHGEILYNWKLRIFLRLSKSKISLFLAVSNIAKKILITKSKVNRDKILVFYNFVDLDKFNIKNVAKIKKGRRDLNVKKSQFIIGFMGRLRKVKGCEYLIRALSKINQNYNLIIAGDGKELNNLKKLVGELGLERRVNFIGYKKDPENIYPLFNVLVVPSESESFGLSALESQAMGTPVIASNVDGLNEVIFNKKNGLFFESKNYIDLARKIKLLNKNKLLRKKIIREGLNNSKKYSLKNYLKNLDKIYKDIKC